MLPNCENVPIPGMLSEKDDWAPRKTAPFLWVNLESTLDTTKLDEEPKPMTPANAATASAVRSDSTPSIDENAECERNAVLAEENREETVEYSSGSYGNTNRELRLPLLKLEKQGSSTSSTSSENMAGCSPINGPNLTSVTSDLSASNGEDAQAKKVNRRARMMDFGKRMGDKLGENRKKFEEKGRSFVEKLRENTNPVQ